jgi:hypothetical protein
LRLEFKSMKATPYVSSIGGLIVLVIDIVVIAEILQSNRETLHKVLWTLFVLVFPILGAIIYFLFGRTGHQYQPIG